MKRKYSDEFKLEVVRAYYNSPLGVRSIAKKYNLPSKNYINNWEAQLIQKGKLPKGSTKPNKAVGRTSESIVRKDERTAREKQLEEEKRELKARIQYMESLASVKPYLKKKLKPREVKYEAILALETQYAISFLTRIAGVSRSAYYRYKRKPNDPSAGLKRLILAIYNKSGKRKGYRTIRDTLNYQYGLIVNHKKVLRLMRELGIQSITRKKKKKKPENTLIQDNILKRDFQAEAPYEKFVTDITYFPARHQMVYLCTVIDLYNQDPIAWHISEKQDKQLSLKTIQKLAQKCDLTGSLIHSDQGVHYTNPEYVNVVKQHGMIQSMSRKGNCWDNACAESFFGHLKQETWHLMKEKPQNKQEVIDMVEEYMVYYKHERPQNKLGGMPPSLFKEQQKD